MSYVGGNCPGGGLSGGTLLYTSVDYGRMALTNTAGWHGVVLQRAPHLRVYELSQWRQTDKSREVKLGQLDGADSRPTDLSIQRSLKLHSR